MAASAQLQRYHIHWWHLSLMGAPISAGMAEQGIHAWKLQELDQTGLLNHCNPCHSLLFLLSMLLCAASSFSTEIHLNSFFCLLEVCLAVQKAVLTPISQFQAHFTNYVNLNLQRQFTNAISLLSASSLCSSIFHYLPFDQLWDYLYPFRSNVSYLKILWFVFKWA